MDISIFPCPRARLRIWSRETGSAVPSRVSLLILHTQAESGLVLTHGIPPDFCDGVHLFKFIYTALRHRVSPEFIGVTQLRTDDVHCREPAGTGPVVLKIVPLVGAAILQVTMDQSMCSSLFPHPLIV